MPICLQLVPLITANYCLLYGDFFLLRELVAWMFS